MLPNMLDSLKCVIMCWLNIMHIASADDTIEIFKNDVPFRMQQCSHPLLKLMKETIVNTEFNSSRYCHNNGTEMYYIYDKDLEFVFDSAILVDWFWKILDTNSNCKYLDLHKQLQMHEGLNMDHIKQIVKELIPINITQIEKF